MGVVMIAYKDTLFVIFAGRATWFEAYNEPVFDKLILTDSLCAQAPRSRDLVIADDNDNDNDRTDCFTP